MTHGQCLWWDVGGAHLGDVYWDFRGVGCLTALPPPATVAKGCWCLLFYQDA